MSFDSGRSDIGTELDRVFHALGSRARRRVLVALLTDNPRQENEFWTSPRGANDVAQGPSAIDLHHNHLPHLDEAGFVDWDRDAGWIDRGEDFEDIRPLLELIDDHRDELPDGWP